MAKNKKNRAIIILWKKSIVFAACFFFILNLSACSFKSEKQVQKESGSEQSSEPSSAKNAKKEQDSLENVKEEQEQKNGFTEEELSAEYLEKDVSDYFEIKGVVTPKSVYEDGVGIYRVKIYRDRMIVPIKRAASAFPGIEPDWESLEKDGSTWAELPFHETGGKRTGMISSGSSFCRFLYGSFDDVTPYKNTVFMWNNYVPQKEKEDLPFLGMKEAVGEVMDVVKALTDSEVSESYTAQSFPETSGKIISEYFEMPEEEQEDYPGSFYYFLFYLSKDGIKLDTLVDSFPKEDGVSYPKGVFILENNEINVIGDYAIQAIYTEEGLEYLKLKDVVEPLELYETMQVLSLEEMAEKLDSYFASKLGMPKTTVTEMELRYDTAVSEPDENGKAVTIIKPYWVVMYFDGRLADEGMGYEHKYKGWRKEVFDAQTGEFLTTLPV